MQGSLQQLPLPEVLQFISMGKSSGVLSLKRDDTEITLTIRAGKVINSSAIDRRLRLGDLLVHRGLLKRSELVRILKLQKKVESDKRLGQILVERDIVPATAIRETLRLQLEEEIWNLFGWTDGSFVFENLDPDQLGDAIVQIDIEPMILEGTRRNDEWGHILEVIPNDLLVPTVSASIVELAESPSVGPREWSVLSHVNGHFTIRVIVNRSTLGRFDVHLILSQLLREGLVRMKSPEELALESPVAAAAQGGNGFPAEPAPKQRSGGLLGSLMSSRKNDHRAAAEEFQSPIGLLAYLAGVMVQRATSLKEFNRKQENDDRILETIWFDLLPLYSRADAIQVRGNQVDPLTLETYLAGCEFADYLDDCFEDATEGLLALLQQASRMVTQRVGEKAVARIGQELIDDIVSKARIVYRSDYEGLNERITLVCRGG